MFLPSQHILNSFFQLRIRSQKCSRLPLALSASTSATRTAKRMWPPTGSLMVSLQSTIRLLSTMLRILALNPLSLVPSSNSHHHKPPSMQAHFLPIMPFSPSNGFALDSTAEAASVPSGQSAKCLKATAVKTTRSRTSLLYQTPLSPRRLVKRAAPSSRTTFKTLASLWLPNRPPSTRGSPYSSVSVNSRYLSRPRKNLTSAPLVPSSNRPFLLH